MASSKFSQDRFFQPASPPTGEQKADIIPEEQPLGIRVIGDKKIDKIDNLLEGITIYGPTRTLLDFSNSHFTRETFSQILQTIEQCPCPFVTKMNFTGCYFGQGKQDCFDLLGPFLSRNSNVKELMCEGIHTDKIASLERHLGGFRKISFGLSPPEIKLVPLTDGGFFLDQRSKPTEAQLRLDKQIVGICHALRGAPIHSLKLNCAMLTPQSSAALSLFIPQMPELREWLLPSLLIGRRVPITLQDEVKGSLYNEDDAQAIVDNLCEAFQRSPKLRKVVLSDLRLLSFVDYLQIYEKICSSLLNHTHVEEVVLTCPATEGPERCKCLESTIRASNQEMSAELVKGHDRHYAAERYREWSQVQQQALNSIFEELRGGLVGSFVVSWPLLRLITSYMEEPRLFEVYPMDAGTRYLNLNQPEIFRFHFSTTQQEADVNQASKRYNKVLTVVQPVAVSKEIMLFHAFRFWVATTNNYLLHKNFKADDQVGPILLNVFGPLNKQLELDMYKMYCLLSQPEDYSRFLSECYKRIFEQLNFALKEVQPAGSYNFIVKTMAAITKKMEAQLFIPTPGDTSMVLQRQTR